MNDAERRVFPSPSFFLKKCAQWTSKTKSKSENSKKCWFFRFWHRKNQNLERGFWRVKICIDTETSSFWNKLASDYTRHTFCFDRTKKFVMYNLWYVWSIKGMFFCSDFDFRFWRPLQTSDQKMKNWVIFGFWRPTTRPTSKSKI